MRHLTQQSLQTVVEHLREGRYKEAILESAPIMTGGKYSPEMAIVHAVNGLARQYLYGDGVDVLRSAFTIMSRFRNPGELRLEAFFRYDWSLAIAIENWPENTDGMPKKQRHELRRTGRRALTAAQNLERYGNGPADPIWEHRAWLLSAACTLTAGDNPIHALEPASQALLKAHRTQPDTAPAMAELQAAVTNIRIGPPAPTRDGFWMLEDLG